MFRSSFYCNGLAPGIAVAESPPGGESFGLNRCDLLAAGVLDAHSDGVRTLARRLDAVVERFRSAGVAIDKPYAAGGSTLLDDVALTASGRPRAGSLRPRAHRTAGPETCLDAARRIGASLVETAIWAGDRCTWVGVDGPLDPRSPPDGRAACSPVDGDLYTGTAGIAMFLAELAATTGDVNTEAAALGAARHALSHAVAAGDASGGLYTGAMSGAFGAAYAGVRLGDGAISDAVRKLSYVFDTSASDCDLLSGLAGAAIVLLTLARVLDEPPLDELATAAADALLRRADRAEYGLSWRSTVAMSAVNLVGFSHGTAGIAHALLEVFAATGNDAYRAAAIDAFAYERAWFDPDARNWPTLLGARPSITPSGARRLRPMIYWCHGAPGVALARLRAYELLGATQFEQEARVALDTTVAALEAIGDVRLENFSLCHGLADNASVLLEGCATLPSPAGAWRDVAHRVARAGLEVHNSADDWLCGSRAPGTPGLMVGIAGIGMFYLRLYDPTVPSVLLVRPSQIAERLALNAA